MDLTWTNPVRTSDGVLLTGKHGSAQVVAEICRKATPVDTCIPVGRVHTLSGQPGTWHDTLPSALAVGPARLLTYQIQTQNDSGKGSQPVAVDTLAGMAPHPVLGLTATLVSQGVALRWRPDADPAADHVLLHVTRGSASTGTNQLDGGKDRAALLSVEIAGADHGGALDVGARLGIAQLYTVQRTRMVHLSAGTDLLMSSAPVSVAERADARPAPLPPPTGLEAVVNTLNKPEVDLVWEPVDGAAGYILYRTAGAEAPERLNSALVTGFTFTDGTVSLGNHLRYSIVTVDSSGQVGPHSVDLPVNIPTQ